MSFSEYVTRSDIEAQRSVALNYDFTGTTTSDVTIHANFNLDFQPDICIVDQVTYNTASASLEETVYTIYADFANGGRQSISPGVFVYQNPLASFFSDCSVNVGTVVKVQKPIVGDTQFVIQSLRNVNPAGYLSILMRFVKFKHNHSSKKI